MRRLTARGVRSRAPRPAELAKDLVGVSLVAGPELEEARRLVTVGHVDAKVLAGELDVAVGDVPGLLRSTGIALPDLEPSAVLGFCASETQP